MTDDSDRLIVTENLTTAAELELALLLARGGPLTLHQCSPERIGEALDADHVGHAVWGRRPS